MDTKNDDLDSKAGVHAGKREMLKITPSGQKKNCSC